MVGGRRGRPGIRRKMAPRARRDLAAEIDVDAVAVRRVWARRVVRDPDEAGESEQTVIARVDAEARPDVAAWLGGADEDDDDSPRVRADWIFFSTTPEAVLIAVAEGGEEDRPLFRFNLRFPADRYRRHLEALAESGLLGLTTAPLELGPERQLESRCAFVAIPTRPLRDFLRELPPVPVV